MKKKLVVAVLLFTATYTNSLGDSVPIVPPSGTGAPHSCDVTQYYPKNLIPACVQGTVEIKFRIGVSGLTNDFEISRSSGSRGLDDATKACIADWHYNPATQNGISVEVSRAARINWSLGGRACVPTVPHNPEDCVPQKTPDDPNADTSQNELVHCGG